ncbi:MAG: TRZ/ATZ family hydrolase [Rhodocyclaceae bacterium]|nr:TRZ/ATZ family hydrolase [Rhodocyclaceae bacterium]
MKTGKNTSPAPASADTPEAVDLLIHARWIIPVEPAGITLENHSLAVHDGRIAGLLPRADAERRFAPSEVVELGEHVLLPGFVNLHTHAAMTLMRGLADDLPLEKWLGERIWPAESRHVSAEFVHDGTLLAAAEMLRGGITCCNDMYFFPDAAARAFTAAGMRAMLGITVLEFPTPYASDADDYIAKGLAVRDAWRTHPLISFSLAPHAPYTVSDRTFERIATLSAQLDLPVHVHVHEAASEIENSLKQYGMRPLTRLHQLGLVNPSLIAVHAVHLDVTDIGLLAMEGASVAHNPTSNMKLASGASPVVGLARQGINIGLGTDGAASNNRLDMFQEMRHAALLGKLTAHDAAALNAHTVLHMATLGGARAMGLADSIGSLEIGKFADMCAIRLDDWLLQPCFAPASHLIYVAGREQVSHVWVAGQCRVNAHTLVDFDLPALLAVINLWQNKLQV